MTASQTQADSLQSETLGLLVDIGNTSLKWACWDGSRLGEMQSARHEGALPLDVLAAWDALEGVQSLTYCSVGPDSVVETMVRVARARWHLDERLRAEPGAVATEHPGLVADGGGQGSAPIREIRCHREAFGVCIAYAEPARLGVDRFLALVGAHSMCAGPALVVDAGTAVTLDLLRDHGQHLGGLILPGMRMMRDSLLVGTQIPRYEPLAADSWFAADTGEAIAAGSLQAIAATAERLLTRLAALVFDAVDPVQVGEAIAPPRLILTGGDAERILPVLDVEAELVPDLVLRGLSRFA